MRINIFNIDFDRAYSKNELYFQFLFISTVYHDIEIKIYDPYFKSDLGIIPHTLSCTPGGSYWVEFCLSQYTPWGTYTGPTFGFKAGFVIEFFSKTSGERYTEPFKYGGKNYTYKNLSLATPLNERRIYMIGNSHIWSTFGLEEENINRLNNFCLSKQAFYGLSLYKFFTGNYVEFLQQLPMVQNDVILFYWGTSDLRYSIFKRINKYGIDLIEALYDVLYLYYFSLKRITEEYPNTKIIVTSVNVGIKKTHLNSLDHDIVFYNSSDIDRKKISAIFNDFMNRKVNHLKNVTFFKWDDEYYTDDEGYIKEELLYPNDIHIKDSSHALELLSNHLYHWGI